MSFADRIARHLDHPIDGACAARPLGTIRTTALCAGAGAAIGSVGGGPVFAGIGAAIGVIIGYAIVAARAGERGQTVSMALVLGPDRLDLLRLSMLRSRPTGTVRSIPYAEINAVEARERLADVRVRILADKGPLTVETTKFGVGAGRPVVEELKRRIGA